MMKPTLLIITEMPVAKDPRALRQIRFLRPFFKVTVLGDSPFPNINGEIEYLPIVPYVLESSSILRRLMLLCGSLRFRWKPLLQNLRILNGRHFDLILVNSLWPLPLALRAANGAPVFWDAHEYYPGELPDNRFGCRLSNRAADFLCKRLIPQTAGIATVCDSIAEEYQIKFGIPKPIVIRNIPSHVCIEPSRTDGKIRLLYHGVAAPSRKLELLIQTVRLLKEDFQLTFMLLRQSWTEEYICYLKKISKNLSVSFSDAVPTEEIAERTNKFDIGIFLHPPLSLNSRFALPNKFFEFIQARLAVAIGPSPEMARLVKKYEIGIVSDDFSPESMADQLNRITLKDIARWKKNTVIAAEDLCAEREMPLLTKSLLKLCDHRSF